MAEQFDPTTFDPKDLQTEQNADPLIWTHEDEGSLTFIPRRARIADSSIEKSKFSILVVGELLVPRTLRKLVDKRKETYDEVEAKAGDIVGVWISGGLQRLIMFANEPVMLEPTGEEKEVGKGNAMRVFSIKSRKNPKLSLVPLEADFRDKSRTTESPWELVATNAKDLATTGKGESVPF